MEDLRKRLESEHSQDISQDPTLHSKLEMRTLKIRTMNHAALLAQGFNMRASRDKDGIEHGGAHAFEMVVRLNAFAACNKSSVSLAV